MTHCAPTPYNVSQQNECELLARQLSLLRRSLTNLVVRTGCVLMIGSTQNFQHLVCSLELLYGVPLSLGILRSHTVTKLLMTPCQDKSWSTKIMFVEVNSSPLVFNGIRNAFVFISLPQNGIHNIKNPMSFKNI